MPSSRTLLRLCLLLGATAAAQAGPPQTVLIDHPGNKADTTGYGSVGYPYRIGKYEVTNAEYAEFLNGKAASDPHQLYDGRMAGEYGGIARSGSSGSFRYETIVGCAQKPVCYVTWESCVRYVNWLTNGRGAGDTERGAYQFAAGGVTSPDRSALAAGKAVSWVLPSEDEWYKAAYYDPEKDGGGYWPYAVRGGDAPKCNLNSNVVTEAGSFAGSPSPLGTFDQNGNMWEYLDARAGNKVGLRGGSFFINDNDSYLRSSARYEVLSAQWPNYGFRVVALGADVKAKPAATDAPAKAVVPPAPAPAVSPPLSPPPAPARSKPRVFYVSQSEGNDDLNGLDPEPKGPLGPWKTLARASIEYIPGDKILLRRGDTWNEELAPKGNGTPAKPITIGTYGEGPRPVIDRQDDKQDLVGIRFTNQAGFRITGIEFARCMTGIYAEYADGSPTREFFWIEDCYFHDALHYQHYEDYPKRKIGLGICFFSYELDKRIVLTDITIKNCLFRRLASGIWTNSPDNFNKNASFVYNFGNMTLDGCRFEEGYQWQMGIRGVEGGLVRDCVTIDVGRNFRAFNGVAGGMFFRCKDWLFENSEWGYVSIGLGSGDGEAFDFEGNCDNMTMRNCLFHDTDGPGFLLCCYASDGNPNRKVVMENCVINAKSKRPIGLPRCAIVNTTDWTESTWKACRFYLSEGEALMRVMDPEKDKRTTFLDCFVKKLADAASTPNLATQARATASSHRPDNSAGNACDGKDSTAWIPETLTDPSLVLEFRAPTAITEFKIAEAASSSIGRYRIECWDDNREGWVNVFNGMEIGPSFVASIVPRTTRKVRLTILQISGGPPAIAEFGVYHDTTGALPITAGGQPAEGG